MARPQFAPVALDLADDPRFAGVWDERGVGAYLMLRLVAEAAWPSPAGIPRNVSDEQVARLSEAGIIEMRPGERFVMVGLTDERERRSERGRAGGLARQERHRQRTNASDGSANAQRPLASRKRTLSQSESESESESERGVAIAPPPGGARATFERLTGRRASKGALPILDRMVAKNGDEPVSAKLEAEWPKVLAGTVERGGFLTHVEGQLARDADRAKHRPVNGPVNGPVTEPATDAGRTARSNAGSTPPWAGPVALSVAPHAREAGVAVDRTDARHRRSAEVE